MRNTSLSLLCLLLCLLPAILQCGESAEGPAWTPAGAIPPGVLPLDMHLATGGTMEDYPGLACPTGDGFLEWAAQQPASAPSGNRFGGGIRSHGNEPLVIERDGILVVEDDGSLTRYDNVFDLEGQTLSFTPTASGYDVELLPLAYEPDPGTQLFNNQRGFYEEPVTLTNFSFPFGGASYTDLWMTSNMLLSFVDPSAASAYQLIPDAVVADRSPRVAPLHQGTSLYGWNGFLREEADRAVFTWQANGGDRIDVQAVLYADGRIQFHYQTVGNPLPLHGAASVVTGTEPFWTDWRSAGAVTDAGGEATAPDPDRAALEILGVSVFQLADSGLVRYDVELEAAPPAGRSTRLRYFVDLRDEATDPNPFRTLRFDWVDGAWTRQPRRVTINGTTLEIEDSLDGVALTNDDLHVTVRTDWRLQQGDPTEAQDDAAGLFTFPGAMIPVMLDFSEQAPLTDYAKPLFEAFTVPDLLHNAVRDLVYEHLRTPRFDGVAIYQNFHTDIIFFAGAYATVGNPKVDGISPNMDSGGNESPNVMHMNKLSYGWNNSATGSWHVLSHEFGHRWLYFFRIDENGNVGRVLNPISGHPAAWVANPGAGEVYDPTDNGPMGGGDWADNGDGTFTVPDRYTNYAYSWHDLYLMGLADPAEVPDWFYIQDTDPPQPDAYYPTQGVTVTGTRVDVSVDQIIAAEGPRFPAYPDSRSDFEVVFVLLTRPGTVQDAEVQEAVDICVAGSQNFLSATVDRATFRCLFHPPDGVIDTPAGDQTVVRGTSFDFTGTGTDPDADPVLLEWDFAGQAPPATGPGPHQVTFPVPGTYDVVLTAVDDTGMLDPTPDSVRITVENQPPDGVIDVPASDLTVTTDDDVSFEGSGTDPENDAVTLLWSFDGAAPDAQGPGPHTFRFPAPGIYDVTLLARDEFGAVDPTPAARTITVENRPPNGTIVVPGLPQFDRTGAVLSFEGVGDDPDGQAVTLSWDFDGVAPGAQGPGPHDVLFPSPGIYTITLTAEDEMGLSDPTPDTRTVTICEDPAVEVTNVRVRKSPGNLHVTWTDLTPAVDDYVVFRSTVASGPFSWLVQADAGDPGATIEWGPALQFLEVAGRNLPICVGPY